MKHPLKTFVLMAALSGVAMSAQAQVTLAHTVKPDAYRIPSIVENHQGQLIALYDHRAPNYRDVGFGNAISIKARTSKNGRKWTEPRTILQGDGISGFRYAFGDAATVIDSKSDSVLLISAAGTASYHTCKGRGEADRLQVSRTWSVDGGRTWLATENISNQIYDLFGNDQTLGSMFVASGRICQSRQIQGVTGCYRLYAAVCTHQGSRVIYSDDFGQTWAVLGGRDARPVPTDGDEAKCEELPDGNVLLSARKGGGRYFNIFKYADPRTASGEWQQSVSCSMITSNGGCNGEILVLPYASKDHPQRFIALQSTPTCTNGGADGRGDVKIFYKYLNTSADYDTPEDFTHWDGAIPVSTTSSAYSTMIQRKNGTLALLYEENNQFVHERIEAYDIIFKQIDLSKALKAQ